MSRSILPLNPLRAFEAAARHLSFSKAAAELRVTPAAISHQVKELEESIGQPLFRRLTRALSLTEAGRTALPLLREGLDLMAEASDIMRRKTKAMTLRVTAEPSFAGRWLLPRLPDFRRKQPGIDLWLDASSRVVDLAREPVDLAIRWGSGRYPELQVDRLFDDEFVAVCSPRLLPAGGIAGPAELAQFTLLHLDWSTEEEAPDWPAWFAAAGVEEVDASRGPRFNIDAMAVEAALAGQGVALVSRVLVSDDLAAGRLVQPWTLVLPFDFALWLVGEKERAQEPAIRAFREWLLATARAAPTRSG
ncbi:MAG: transcriptional regulator GcvA [Geminicoccaceae bacterium]